MSTVREVVNPADENVIASVCLLELEEVDEAIERAAAGTAPLGAGSRRATGRGCSGERRKQSTTPTRNWRSSR